MTNSTDLLKLQNNEQVKNTYYRSPKVSPSIRKESSDCISVYTAEDKVEVRRLEEVIFYILADFKFIPYWLVQRWYTELYNRPELAFSEVSKWIRVGLTWIQSSATGVYLRPTRFLLDMFNEDITQTNYTDIPYNQLTHTISEQQVFFDIQIGNPKSEFWQYIKENEELLPCYHPLLTDLNNGQRLDGDGTIILREALFRKGTTYRSTEEWLQGDELIRNQIRNGAKFTEEFNDFTLFNIVTINQSGNETKDDVYKQYPDLLIPVPRKEGIAQSYSIEIEISAKSPDRYDAIMQSYKNNIKFGKLFYLCLTPRITRLVKDAFNRIGGLGTCQLYTLPYTPPSMEIANFSREDEILQQDLLDSSNNNTN